MLLRSRGAAFDVRLLIADVDTPFGAIEDRRRNDAVAIVGVTVGDPPDVGVDAEDLLDNDEPSPHDP